MALGLAAAFYIAWNLGANDAANPTSTAVGSGAISIRKAIIMFSTFAAIGAVAQGYMVMKTIGKGVVKDIDPLGALIASIMAGIWITLVTWKGLPVSTTHSTVGAVLGIGLAYNYLQGSARINWNVVYMVVSSWIISPLLAILLSIIMYFLLRKLANYLILKGKNVDRFFKMFLLFNLAFAAYSYGTNDVGNATGVYITVASKVMGTPDITTMIYLAMFGALGVTVGALTWGYKVINTIGLKITRLDYISASAAVFSNAMVVWGFSTIPKILWGYGMPISTTHASVSSVIGVGIAKNRSLKGVDWKIVGYIIVSWILTVPVAAALSFIVYVLASNLFPIS